MAATDPYEPPGGRAQRAPIPRAEPLPPASPLVPGQVLPQAQPLVPPRSTPVGRPLPQPQPVPAPPPATPQVRPVSPQPQPIAAGSGPRRIVVPSGSKKVIRPRDEDDEEPEDLSALALRNSPPWLISAAFHMALLIVLGLLVGAIDRGNKSISLEAVADDELYAEDLGDQLQFDSPLGMDNVKEVQEPEMAISNLPEVEDPFAAPPLVELYPDGTMATSDIQSKQIGLALDGREEGSKRSLLGKYGGTATTEAAVLAGLQWLARNQLKSGGWSLSGPYAGGVIQDVDNPVAATAMALLAFQGYGVTHKQGTPPSFRQNVARGWGWLLEQQDADGNFYHEGPMHHRFYTQGQCAIALCELYGMSKDPQYKEPAERAVQYCLRSQSSEGGWRYNPNADSDVSVTGWIVMALQSARMAGLEVPEDHFRQVERFLDKVAQDDGALYPYQEDGDVRPSMTAEALLCRQYLGWRREDPRLVRGVEWLLRPEHLVNFDRDRNVYYWYYATQVMHHMEGESWGKWNEVMRQVMPEQQVKEGREKGSWDPDRPSMDQWGPHGGRLYVTCLSIYMLEVYYRHLPLYTKVYTNLLKSGRSDRLGD